MPRLRFSLRWLFGVVSFVGAGCALLVYATPFWSKLIFTCTLAALVAAGVTAFVRKEARRAFWAGFAGVGLAYLWLVCGTWQTPAGVAPLRDCLLTTAVLDWCHGKMPHTRSIPPTPPGGMFSVMVMGDSSTMTGGSTYGPMTGGGAPMGGMGPMGGMPAGMGPMGGMPGGMLGAPPGAILTAPPDVVDFSIAGHSLFALLFAMLGGLLAQRGYCAAQTRRPLADDSSELSSN